MAASPKQLQERMALWGLDNSMQAEAAAWYERVSTDTYIASGVMMPCQYDGTQGVLVAVSTNQTSSLENQHNILNEQGILVTEPSWLGYEVWWFRGMAFLNWHGITDPAHQGVFAGYLGDVLDRLCASRGMPQWRSQFCHIFHGQ